MQALTHSLIMTTSVHPQTRYSSANQNRPINNTPAISASPTITRLYTYISISINIPNYAQPNPPNQTNPNTARLPINSGLQARYFRTAEIARIHPQAPSPPSDLLWLTSAKTNLTHKRDIALATNDGIRIYIYWCPYMPRTLSSSLLLIWGPEVIPSS